MAGHNKWSKIKRGKAITDAKRGNAFSKLSKEITLAAKHGGGSIDMNARLRSAVLAARAANRPTTHETPFEPMGAASSVASAAH